MWYVRGRCSIPMLCRRGRQEGSIHFLLEIVRQESHEIREARHGAQHCHLPSPRLEETPVFSNGSLKLFICFITSFVPMCCEYTIRTKRIASGWHWTGNFAGGCIDRAFRPVVVELESSDFFDIRLAVVRNGSESEHGLVCVFDRVKIKFQSG